MTEPRAGLQVPKSPVRIALALDGGAAREVQVFVAEHVGEPARRQEVADLLDGPGDAFLPVLDVADGTWNLVNRDAITWVGMPRESGDPAGPDLEGADTSVDGELYEVRKAVAIHLVGGGQLAGELLYSPAESRGRVADFLNDSRRFFRLWTAEAVYLIQRRAVVRLIER